MSDNNHATKQDLDELRSHLDRRFEEVLREFRNWARPVDIALRAQEERLALLEQRMFEMERGQLLKH